MKAVVMSFISPAQSTRQSTMDRIVSGAPPVPEELGPPSARSGKACRRGDIVRMRGDDGQDMRGYVEELPCGQDGVATVRLLDVQETVRVRVDRLSGEDERANDVSAMTGGTFCTRTCILVSDKDVMTVREQVDDVRETNALWLAARQRLARPTGPTRDYPPAYTAVRSHPEIAMYELTIKLRYDAHQAEKALAHGVFDVLGASLPAFVERCGGWRRLLLPEDGRDAIWWIAPLLARLADVFEESSAATLRQLLRKSDLSSTPR
jgi:hypothetical protein